MFVLNKTLLYISIVSLFPKEAASAYGLKMADLQPLCHHFFSEAHGRHYSLWHHPFPRSFLKCTTEGTTNLSELSGDIYLLYLPSLTWLQNRFDKLTLVFLLPLRLSGQTHFYSIELDHLTSKAIECYVYISKASQDVWNGIYWFLTIYVTDTTAFFRPEDRDCLLIINMPVSISPQILALVKFCPCLLKDVSFFLLWVSVTFKKCIGSFHGKRWGWNGNIYLVMNSFIEELLFFIPWLGIWGRKAFYSFSLSFLSV